MCPCMKGDRIAKALARIAAAADRIESCGRVAGEGRILAAENERRHAALRAETGAALRELDVLIAELGK